MSLAQRVSFFRTHLSRYLGSRWEIDRTFGIWSLVCMNSLHPYSRLAPNRQSCSLSWLLLCLHNPDAPTVRMMLSAWVFLKIKVPLAMY